MDRIILIKYGEIILKGLNRPFFEGRLIKNIKAVLPSGTRITIAQATIYVELEEVNMGDIVVWAEKLSRVFGVVSVAVACVAEKDMGKICELAAKITADSEGTFKVEAKRADKRFPYKSPEIAATVGSAILSNNKVLKVDVNNPDMLVMVEIRDFHAYVYCNEWRAQKKDSGKARFWLGGEDGEQRNRRAFTSDFAAKRETWSLRGVGGMPIGTAGRAMLMLSGGIDSPVAGYMIAKRGVELEAVHFFSPPYTSERAKEKVQELARLLAVYTGRIKLHIVPFTDIQVAIRENCPEEQLTIIMRRFMVRIAERLAQKQGASALATGESIGQVASQTMQSLAVTELACGIPIFRPLIGMDKEEIIAIAEKIGTFETSILPYEDCCTIFTPKHPNTKPKLEKILLSEGQLSSEALIAAALEGTEEVVCYEN